MGVIFGYWIFFAVFGSANGFETLFDPTNLFGLINLLLWLTIIIALVLLCKKPSEEEERRWREIQERGKQLKQRYRETGRFQDYHLFLIPQYVIFLLQSQLYLSTLTHRNYIPLLLQFRHFLVLQCVFPPLK